LGDEKNRHQDPLGNPSSSKEASGDSREAQTWEQLWLAEQEAAYGELPACGGKETAQDDREIPAWEQLWLAEQKAAYGKLPARKGKKGGRVLAVAALIVSSLVLLPSLALMLAFVAGLLNSGAYVSGEPDRSLQINREDDFVLIVHKDNPVESPTLEQVRGSYPLTTAYYTRAVV
jgi:hypothetical protein